MRVLLVGAPGDRERIRSRLIRDAYELAGEFASIGAARASGLSVDAIVMAVPEDDDGPVRKEPLTPREIEVLELLTEGRSNRTIAGKLGISDQTVKFHVAAICSKLGAANRTDAVRQAIRRGLVSV